MDTPHKTENWHALSHQQYFLRHRFLDISLLVFNTCDAKTEVIRTLQILKTH